MVLEIQLSYPTPTGYSLFRDELEQYIIDGESDTWIHTGNYVSVNKKKRPTFKHIKDHYKNTTFWIRYSGSALTIEFISNDENEICMFTGMLTYFLSYNFPNDIEKIIVTP